MGPPGVQHHAAVRGAGPTTVAVATAVAALAFVVLRLFVAADGDISRFVVAGSTFVDRDTVTPPIHVFDSNGYDGQFMWRFAVDPADRSEVAHGVRLDQPNRQSRVGYPTAAWLAAGGVPGLVTWSLVAVNVAAIGAIAGFGADFARRRGWSAWWGLAIAATPGLAIALSRDLAEVVMVAGVLGGIVALDRRRPVWAGIAFGVALLSHEQMVYVVAVLALARLAAWVRRTDGVGVADLAWAVPVAMFVAWQLVCRSFTGVVPVLAFGDRSTVVPFTGLAGAVGDWMSQGLDRQQVLLIPQAAALAAVVVVAVRGRARLEPSDQWLLWSLAAGLAVAACLSHNVWRGEADLRQVVLVPVLAWLVVFAEGPPSFTARPWRRWIPAGTAFVAVATLGLRVVAI